MELCRKCIQVSIRSLISEKCQQIPSKTNFETIDALRGNLGKIKKMSHLVTPRKQPTLIISQTVTCVHVANILINKKVGYVEMSYLQIRPKATKPVMVRAISCCLFLLARLESAK